MGAASTLLLFDVVRHRSRTVPAILEWVERGTLQDWWSALLNRYGLAFPDENDRATLEMANELEGALQLKSALDLPARLAETTSRALEIAFLTSVGDGVAFGNASSLLVHSADLVTEIDEVMRAHGHASISTLTGTLPRLIATLDLGLEALQHASGGFGEGLRGGLDEEQTTLLVAELSALALDTRGIDRRDVVAARSDPTQACLLAMAVMGARAIQSGVGLLHGRDLELRNFGEWTTGIFDPRV